MVMRGDSCTEGGGFDSLSCILDGHFPHIFVVKIVMLAQKEQIKRKRRRGWPI